MISDEYIKAFSMMKQFNPCFTGTAYMLNTALNDLPKMENYFNITGDDLIAMLTRDCNNIFWEDLPREAQIFYVLCYTVFDIHVDETGRNIDLKNVFRKKVTDSMRAKSHVIPTAPAWVSDESIKAEDLFRLSNQVGVIPIYVNLKYPVKETLEEIKKLIEKEQERFFSQCEWNKSLSIKKDTTGRSDTYPFDEWARYLEIYLLRKCGEPQKKIAEKFYADNYASIKADRDRRKAANLSKNAIWHTFPGKY